jgi:UDPglucose--hexose-1-phosphate uridylyltransferase
MSLLRYDVTTNDWVIFAPDRVRPPNRGTREAAAGSALPASPPGPCPFCPGNEHLTTPEIYALQQGGGAAGWSVRVVSNKFPALRIEDDPRRVEEGLLFRRMGGCGAHEVLIESPDHNSFLGTQPVEQVERVLGALQVRFNDLMRDTRFQVIVPFKNHGEGAGTSLRHPHWQLIATPVVPRRLRLKHAVAEDYFDQSGRCLYCVLVEEELFAEERVLAVNEYFAAVLPYASGVPFETWILPRRHQPSFGREDAAHLRPLAELLRLVLRKLYVGLENPDFNLTVNTAPRGDEDKGYFLWHIEVLPRLATPAGFELGSGMAINTILPEEAAHFLRNVQGD